MFHDVGPIAFVNQHRAMLARSESFSVLPRIHSPTLVIHAALDQNFSLEEHQELSEKIAGARLAVVENSGHMSPMERPEAITALLRKWIVPHHKLKSILLQRSCCSCLEKWKKREILPLFFERGASCRNAGTGCLQHDYCRLEELLRYFLKMTKATMAMRANTRINSTLASTASKRAIP